MTILNVYTHSEALKKKSISIRHAPIVVSKMDLYCQGP